MDDTSNHATHSSRFPTLFLKRAKERFSQSETLEKAWQIPESADLKADSVTLMFHKQAATGYDITVRATDDAVHLQIGGLETAYMVSSPVEDFIQEMLDTLTALLSPAMRLREISSEGNAFRWHLDRLNENGEWEEQATMKWIAWKPFGPRKETVYMNRVMETDG